MKALLLNQDWFAAEWRAEGHDVVTCGVAHHLDVVLPSVMVRLEHVLSLLPKGFSPDVIVYHDNSSPVIFPGLERTEIPTVFYSVDTQHHAELHRILYELFDATFVAQRDYIESFHAEGKYPTWLPPWAPRYVEPCAEKAFGAAFVGTLSAELNPDRVAFFDRLRKLVPVYCGSGDYWEVFPKSEIVVNQTVRGDLNFRVFESMMCGAALLTERSGNGLGELFREGQQLVTYTRGDADEAAARVRELLSNPVYVRTVAAEGRAAVLERHTARHRAALMGDTVWGIKKSVSPRRRLAAAANYTSFAAKLERRRLPGTSSVLVQALTLLEEATSAGERCNDILGCFAVLGCTAFDALAKSDKGARLLQAVAEANPDVTVLQYARLRGLLNLSMVDEATRLASKLGHDEPKEVFGHVERTLSALVTAEFGLE